MLRIKIPIKRWGRVFWYHITGRFAPTGRRLAPVVKRTCPYNWGSYPLGPKGIFFAWYQRWKCLCHLFWIWGPFKIFPPCEISLKYCFMMEVGILRFNGCKTFNSYYPENFFNNLYWEYICMNIILIFNPPFFYQKWNLLLEPERHWKPIIVIMILLVLLCQPS